MSRMKTVMTVRLSEEELKIIQNFSEKENTDKSTALRVLLDMGRLYLAVSRYAEGKASIGKASELAGISLSEMIDLLAKLGIKSLLEPGDYLQGIKTARKLF